MYTDSIIYYQCRRRLKTYYSTLLDFKIINLMAKLF